MDAPDRKDARLTRGRRLPAALYPAVFDHKKSFPGKYMILCLGPASRLPHAQLGIATSRKTLNTAVARNRARRLMREAFRTQQTQLPPGARLILVARRRIAEDGALDNVSRDFRMLCDRAGLWVKNPKSSIFPIPKFPNP